jgi:hypothetical protein
MKKWFDSDTSSGKLLRIFFWNCLIAFIVSLVFDSFIWDNPKVESSSERILKTIWFGFFFTFFSQWSLMKKVFSRKISADPDNSTSVN